jgi:acetyltransferase-like isoleucine patch superfamily enzyme
MAVARGSFYKWILHGLSSRLTIGNGFRLRGRLSVRGPGRVVLGDNVIVDGRGHPVTLHTHSREAIIEIGNGVFLNGTRMGCARRIEIGDRCILSDARIGDTDHHGIHPEDRRNAAAVQSAAVVIGENVWVGMAVLVLKGATIGRNSLVGAGAVVTGAIPDNCVAAGNPAKVVSHFTSRSTAAIAGVRR